MFGNNKDHLTAEQLGEILAPIEERLAKVEELCKKQEEVIQLLTQELQTLKEAPKPQEPEASPGITHQQEQPAPTAQHQSAPNGVMTLYLPAPTVDGIFTSQSEREEEGKSIYRLTTADGRNGTFELLATPDAIATAMISVSQFVKPVCKIEGNVHRMPQHIETIEPGTVQREGDTWRTVVKAVVKWS